jgi:hypothetical protein
MMRSALLGALFVLLALPGNQSVWCQSAGALPDAPQPQRNDDLALIAAELSADGEGQSGTSPNPRIQQPPSPPPDLGTVTGQNQRNKIKPGFPPVHSPVPGKVPIPAASRVAIPSMDVECLPYSSSAADRHMSCDPKVNPFVRFLDTSPLWPLTPRQKLKLAWKNVTDPFNLLTITGEAAFTIGTDAHTADGPGWPGYGKYVGVSLTQDATGEFFGTFLVPSLAHQDPHYYRMPNLPAKRRILHVFDAVVIGVGDDGQPMFNYATVFGTIASSALGNAYVPGRDNSWGASTARIGTALATDPIGNAISEFLPDVARRININVVLVQRVINRVAIQQGAAGSSQ